MDAGDGEGGGVLWEGEAGWGAVEFAVGADVDAGFVRGCVGGHGCGVGLMQAVFYSWTS